MCLFVEKKECLKDFISVDRKLMYVCGVVKRRFPSV